METEKLICLAIEGDKDALIKLIMDKKEEYYRLAYVYLNNKEDTMDALQDMIIILFKNIKKLRNKEVFYSWSKTILINCCRGILKKKKKLIYFTPKTDKEYIEDYKSIEVKQDIMYALGKLNKDQQEAIKMKYFLDLDYETVAKIVKAPIGTVKSRVHNGVSKLRKMLIGGGIHD